MKILAVDVGTGTQDILLYDTRLAVENSFKIVAPSPTMIIHNRIRQATQNGDAVLLTGTTMGGGPNQWAAEEHVKAGFSLYATPDAARSFNDHLEEVSSLGIEIVTSDEGAKLPGSVVRIKMQDFDYQGILRTFDQFRVDYQDLSAVAVAVFDHGAAPADVSDRTFRFDYLDKRIDAANSLSAFAYREFEIPPILTRFQAVARSAAKLDAPVMIMDTAPAAILGATFDPIVRQSERQMIVNIGNFHTLGFRLGSAGIEGVFEHHTGLLDREKLERLMIKFAQGILTRDEVFNDHGHGALIYESQSLMGADERFPLVVTGPRRGMLQSSMLEPHFAAPFGDMMMTGCFGLVAAVADHLPDLAESIRSGMRPGIVDATPPWELG